MVAEERDGAFFDHAGDGVDDVGGIGAVADVVAEEHEASRPHVARVLETGVERLPVAVDVSEERDEHRRTIADPRRP